MTIHLSSLDNAQHEYGPFSSGSQSRSGSHRWNGLSGWPRRRSQRSVHGGGRRLRSWLRHLTHTVNLFIPFMRGGTDPAGGESQTKCIPRSTHGRLSRGWRAEWRQSCFTTRTIARPSSRCANCLQKLAADPNNGIGAVLERDAIKRPAASRCGVPRGSQVRLFDRQRHKRKSGHSHFWQQGLAWILAGVS